MGVALFFVLAIAAVILLFVVSNNQTKRQREERRKALLLKYGNANVVDNIIGRMVWQGQTEAMLIDSLGNPADIDRKVYKTKSKQVWKYRQLGRNRFGTRVTLENGLVVGWDIK